jgi:RNA polymerase sigma-70 factor (ECF subfamily)
MAEDLVQDSFVKLWEKYMGRECESCIPLLFMIVRNKCLDRVKQLTLKRGVEAIRHQQPECDEMLYALDFGTDDRTLYHELEEEIRKVADSLPDRCREVFLMSRMDGMKNKEIAQALGISEKAVEKHITRALKEFKAHLISSGHISPDLMSLIIFVVFIS